MVYTAVDHVGVEREAVEEQQRADGDDEEPARHDAAPEVGQPLEHVAAQRERLAADHEHDDDHEERQRPLEAGRAVLDPEACRAGTFEMSVE